VTARADGIAMILGLPGGGGEGLKRGKNPRDITRPIISSIAHFHKGRSGDKRPDVTKRGGRVKSTPFGKTQKSRKRG